MTLRIFRRDLLLCLVSAFLALPFILWPKAAPSFEGFLDLGRKDVGGSEMKKLSARKQLAGRVLEVRKAHRYR
jgi:hypothetical protein